jgi:hypothetical protein
MKNNLFTRMVFFVVLSLLGFLGHAQTTSLEIGSVKNGVGTITNLTNATHVLKTNLPEGASVSDLKLEYSQYDEKYYLTAKVTSNGISSVGIQLGQTGSTLQAFAGPGVEITCSGYNCNDCRIAFSSYRPYCKCFQSNTTADMRCDMTSRITISL